MLLAIGMGTVSLLAIDNLTGKHEAENLNRIAEQQREDINYQLLQTEDVVDFVANAVNRQLENDIMIHDPKIQQDVNAAMYDSFQNAVIQVPAVCSYFVYYPDNTDVPNGSLWQIRRKNETKFVPCNENMLASTINDDWYKKPVQTGSAQWIEPYYSTVQERYIISYVVPIIKDDAVLAVVGADLDFTQLLYEVSQIRIFDTGTAFLMNLSGTVHYLADSPLGIEATRGGQIKLSHGAWNVPNTNGANLVRHTWNGVEYDMAATNLRNGMAMVVAAPVSEIYAQSYAYIKRIFEILLSLTIICALLALSITRRMTEKLQGLTQASMKIADGQLNVELPDGGNDEIGDLCHALAHTRDELRKSIEELQTMSYFDSLTKIFNRLGLTRDAQKWFKYHEGEPVTLISLDIDNFKLINDVHGHAAGDIALKTLASLLKSNFGKTALVGRNGGDEFVVMLPGVTSSEAVAQIAKFSALRKSYRFNGREHTFTTSLGYTHYPQLATNIKELFHQADIALYAVKLEGKNSFGKYEPSQENLQRTQLGFNMHDIDQNLPAAVLVHKAAGLEADEKTIADGTEGEILFANAAIIKMFGCDDMDDFLRLIAGDYKNLILKDDLIWLDKTEIPAALPVDNNVRYFRLRINNKRGEALPIYGCRRLVESPVHGRIVYAVLMAIKCEKNL